MPLLRLHLNVLVEPTIAVQTLVDSTERAYAQAGVDVKVASRTTLKIPELEIVTITSSCQPPGPLTVDQQNLFKLAGGIGPTEIAIFFVKATKRATNGCSQHPRGLACAVISQSCTRWTMAHEIGHLLDLTHVTGSNNLMFKSTRRIKGDPPKLDSSEIATILSNTLVSNS